MTAKHRQAVVVVHGMGEQKANDFLRGFIDAALPESVNPTSTQYYSKPDRISELFEMRRFTAPSTRERPVTDFYEFYWAYHMKDGKLKQVLPLVRALYLRPPWRVRGSLIGAWLLGWTAAIVVGYLLYQAWNSSLIDTADEFLKLALALGVAGTLGVLIRFFIKSVVTGFVVSHFGDVARYLDAAPGNVEVRQKIRSQGVELLRKLHQSGDYDRIVVVGHSLGSIIAYDILKHLYAEMNSSHGSPRTPSDSEVEKLERVSRHMDESQEGPGAYRTAQRSVWVEQRKNGNSWLVSDFVSLGSPLTHAGILLVHKRSELLDRVAGRELPVSPPVSEDGRFSYQKHYTSEAGDKRSIRVLHHAALFAPTRWTNIFFPSRFGLFGDWFGGELSSIFGSGVSDKPIEVGPWWRLVPVLPHTQYFSQPNRSDNLAAGGSTFELRKAIDLEGKWAATLLSD